MLNLCGRGSDCTFAVQGAAREGARSTSTSMTPLILKRGDPSRRREDDYDVLVLESGKVVGRIFKVPAAAPEGRPWMWASGHGGHIERADARL